MFFIIFFVLTYYTRSELTLIAGYNDLRMRVKDHKFLLSANILVHSGIECSLCKDAMEVLKDVELESEGAIKVYKTDCALKMEDF